MGTTNGSYIMTLVNSIIGVSILAMPFCFHQCGILLASLILVLSNILTRLSCHFLLKLAIMTRRRTYEFLGFHAFGSSGKTAVELCIILMMIGTCIAFFVVVGDLGPAIIGSYLRMSNFTALRPSVLIGIALLVVLPLGLLRNIDSLNSICTASFLFYICLLFKTGEKRNNIYVINLCHGHLVVFAESTDNLFSGKWFVEIRYWVPSGILQCLPIFSMALSCQTQLFEVFDSVPNATLERMNSIVKSAVNLCTFIYITVGSFGYIAFYNQSITGNLLMNFSESIFSELIKLGFVMSVAVSFPLVVFPCRASLYSLLFKKAHVPHYELVSGGGNHIPEAQFKCITVSIIALSLIIGLLAPNIETVLGLVGSTIGVVISLLFPPLFFIWMSTKATNEKVLAEVMCIVSIFIMVMGTYENMYLNESSAIANDLKTINNLEMEKMGLPLDVINVPKMNEDNLKSVADQIDLKQSNKVEESVKSDEVFDKPVDKKPEVANAQNPIKENEKVQQKEEEKRIEPPIPLPPDAANSKGSKNEKPLQVDDKPADQKKPESDIKVADNIANEKEIKSGANESSKAEAIKLENIEKIVKEKPPLPILINASANVERPKLAANDLVPKSAVDVKSVKLEPNEKLPLNANKEPEKLPVHEDLPKSAGKEKLPKLSVKAESPKIKAKLPQTVENVEREKRDLYVERSAPVDEACDKDERNGTDVRKAENFDTIEKNMGNSDIIVAPLVLSDPQTVLNAKLKMADEIKVDGADVAKSVLIRDLKNVDQDEKISQKKR